MEQDKLPFSDEEKPWQFQPKLRDGESKSPKSREREPVTFTDKEIEILGIRNRVDESGRLVEEEGIRNTESYAGALTDKLGPNALMNTIEEYENSSDPDKNAVAEKLKNTERYNALKEEHWKQ